MRARLRFTGSTFTSFGRKALFSGCFILAGLMAFPLSGSQVLNFKEVPFSLKKRSKAWESEDAAKSNVTTGLMPPIVGTLQRAAVNLARRKECFSDGSVPSGLSCRLKPLLRLRKNSEIAAPILRRLQRVESDSTQHGMWCSARIVPDDGDADMSYKVQQQATLQQLCRARIIACLRTSSSKLALDAARAALDGGLTVLEVTMTTPSAAEAIKVLVQEYPSALIGAGTVLSKQDADTAKDAGAKFLMSPALVEELVFSHKDGPVVYIPGAMTATEVISAYNLGAALVKLYPVALVGGIRFVQALKRPLCHIPLIASHGITLDMVEPYIAAGATAVILSDAIFDKTALESKDLGRIKLLARAAASRAASLKNLMPV